MHRALHEPPIASGESGWLAQVQGALQNVQQDLSSISSGASDNPDNLVLDGSQLEGDAQTALDPNYDPPPADNADWVAGMNDYVTAGDDYSGDNTNEQDDNPAQASQEIGAGNAAPARFNAANGGVLNGTIQSLLSETREMRYRRDVHGWLDEISPVPATSKSWRK